MSSNLLTLLDKPEFHPQRLSNLQLWLDSSDLSTITKDISNKVSQWNDKSGNGDNATQNTESFQFTYIANVLNNKAILRGDSNYMNFSNIENMHIEGSVFVIFNSDQSTSALSFGQVLSVNGGDSGVTNARQPLLFTVKNVPSRLVTSHGVVDQISNNAIEGSFHLLTTTYDGLTAVSYLNGMQFASDAATLTVSTSASVIGTSFKGDIAEILVYNRALTIVEISLVEQYLSNKWGLVLL